MKSSYFNQAIAHTKSSLKRFIASGDAALLWLTFLLLFVAFVFSARTAQPFGDIPLYNLYASNIWRHAIPYRDFHIEYPPGVLPFILLPQLVSFLTKAYSFGYIVMSSSVVFWLLRDTYHRYDRRRVVLLSLLLLVFGRFAFFQLDIFAAAALYLCLRTLIDHHFGSSAILLAIATLIKAYPLVCLPAMLLVLPKDQVWKYLRILSTVLVIGLLPFVIISPAGFWYSIAYHTGRPVDISSGPAAVGFMAHLFGAPIRAVFSHGSVALIFPGAHIVGLLSSILLAIGLIVTSVYLFIQKNHTQVALGCLALVMVFIIFFKVGSPQYLLVPVLLYLPASNELGNRNSGKLWLRLFLIVFVVFVTVLFYSIWKVRAPQLGGGLLVIIRTALEVELLAWVLGKIKSVPTKKIASN